MNARMRQLLSRLLDARAPSGFETSAAAVWREEAEGFAEKVWTDVYGNAFAELASEGLPTVMLAGHLDEIGLMVNHIDDEGYLYIRSVGGWDPQVLVGQRIEILGSPDPIVGVVGRRAVHLLDREERDKAVKFKELWIDIGASDGDEARQWVRIGDVAVIRSDTVELANDRIAARSLDDRIGALVALEALRRAAEKGVSAHVVAVGTVQEEVGSRAGGGAGPSSYGVEPDAAIVIDVTHASDHPGVDKKEHGNVQLGSGPVLSRGPVINRVLLDRLTDAAREAEIPFQLQAAPGPTGTDADAIYNTRSGVATAIVSVPNRYMHSPNQLVDAGDVEAAAELIAEFLIRLADDTSFVA